MKKKLLTLSLIILPVTLFLLVLNLRYARGEFFLFDNYDGPYGYLMGALSIAQFLKPGYYHHPGIVTLLLEAFVIKISHIFQGIEANVVMDTLNRPEFYLNRIYIFLNFLAAFALFVFGKVSFEKTGNIFAAIFLQLTPFAAMLIIYELTHNAAETVSFVLILVILTISISYLYENDLTKRKSLLYILLFGITGGLLMVNIISYSPILLIPFLLLKKRSEKVYFVLTALITFSLLYFSITSESLKMWEFLLRGLVHSGKYGTGDPDFIDTGRFIPTLKIIYKEFFFFGVIYLLILITLLLQFVPKFKSQIRSNKFFLLLTGIYLIMTGFIILVVKQIEGYYLFPGLLLSITGLFAVNSVIADLFPKYFKLNKYIYIYVIFIIFTIPIYKKYKENVKFFAERKDESYKIVDYLNENYSDKIIVSTDLTSSMPTAFFYGLYYTGDQTIRYDSLLRQKYPNFVHFNRWGKNFSYLKYHKNLENRLMNADTVVYHSVNEENFNDFKKKITEFTKKENIQYNEVFANKNGEKIYLVLIKD